MGEKVFRAIDATLSNKGLLDGNCGSRGVTRNSRCDFVAAFNNAVVAHILADESQPEQLWRLYPITQEGQACCLEFGRFNFQPCRIHRDANALLNFSDLKKSGFTGNDQITGNVYHQTKNYVTALADYDKALELANVPLDIVHYNRSLALIRLKRWDDALDALQAALAINPESDRVKRKLDHLNAQKEKLSTTAVKPGDNLNQ